MLGLKPHASGLVRTCLKRSKIWLLGTPKWSKISILFFFFFLSQLIIISKHFPTNPMPTGLMVKILNIVTPPFKVPPELWVNF